mmetsp:Transcript_122147/g.379685  ORF Transcript_122147/g.379685 Transcript_122147/m.379685 type:complete len:204 (+) Transcript_122147:102-713(+)
MAAKATARAKQRGCLNAKAMAARTAPRSCHPRGCLHAGAAVRGPRAWRRCRGGPVLALHRGSPGARCSTCCAARRRGPETPAPRLRARGEARCAAHVSAPSAGLAAGGLVGPVRPARRRPAVRPTAAADTAAWSGLGATGPGGYTSAGGHEQLLAPHACSPRPASSTPAAAPGITSKASSMPWRLTMSMRAAADLGLCGSCSS